VHTRIEEEVFYPAVRALREPRLQELAAESVREHATVKRRVQAARAALGDDAALRTAMGEVQACVEHHVREEEGEMFPLVENRMPPAERTALARELGLHKRTAGTRRRTTRRATSAHTSTKRRRKTTTKAKKTSASRKRASAGSR
jgi:hypothetical protein